MLNWDRIWTARPRSRDRSARRRDPFAIGLAILINFGPVAPLAATLVGSAVIGGALLAASLLVSALTPQQQRPRAQDRQATVRQSLSPRWRYYGRNKVGGLLWFFESKDGLLYSGVAFNEGEISEVVEVWLNDSEVTLDHLGVVQENPYFGNGQVARVLFKSGAASQTAHQELVETFAGVVTDDHRLRGVANLLSIFEEVPQEKIAEVYPQGNPGVRVVFDGSLVKSVRTGLTVYSNNPADVIYDYLTGVDGAGFPYGAGKSESQVDLASFQAFANLCDELVPLKSGGTAKRYTINGGYALDEEMRTVLRRMCAACDGDIYINGSGKLAIRGGKWVEPTLTLDSDLGHIITGEFRQGQSALAAFNELNITYTDPAQDYMDTEGERWIDADNLALRGKVLSDQLDLPMVSSHAQARRLAKIHTAKSNPLWFGTIVTNFYGFNALGEETVTIKFGPLGIDTTFLVQSVRILDDLTGVQLEVTSLGASAYEWNAASEEGDPPAIPPDTTTATEILPPQDFSVSPYETGGATYLAATWTEPSRLSLAQEVEYRPTGEPAWGQMVVVDGQGFAQSMSVVAGGGYEVRARTKTPGGVYGDYTSTVSVTATADVGAPDPATDIGALGAVGRATITGVHSISDNSVGVQIWRGATSVFGSSTLIDTQYGSPATAFSYTDTGVSPGDYYYWVVSINGSGIAGTEEPTGLVTVS